MLTGATQAAAFYLRRAQRSRLFTAACTPWSPGLVVQAGAVCQSNGLAWTAQNNGTTAGTVGPNNENGALFVDAGGIQWLKTNLLLVQPEPIG
jgi:hypothetical protein